MMELSTHLVVHPDQEENASDGKKEGEEKIEILSPCPDRTGDMRMKTNWCCW